MLTYAGKMFALNANAGAPTMPTSTPTNAVMALDGALSSFYGFTSGGALIIRTGAITIGPAEQRPDTVGFDYDFFHDNSFGAYDLSSIRDSSIIDGTGAAPAIIAPRQLNYIATNVAFAPGADPLAGGAVGVGLLSDYRRQAVDFALNGNVYYNNADTQKTVAGVSVPDFGAADQLVLGANTKILADAGAAVRLSTGGQLIVAGEIEAHGGSISLVGTNAPKYIFRFPYYDEFAAVWLAPTADLDASGTNLIDDQPPLGYGPDLRLGRVLDGGSVTVSHAQGYVVGMAGARIDVSGASGELDVLLSSDDLLTGRALIERTGMAPVNPYTREAVWSDGGAVNLAASEGFYFNSILDAHGGAPEARGGSLDYQFLSNGRVGNTTRFMTLKDSSVVTTVPSALTLGSILPFSAYGGGTSPGRFQIRSDLIQQSGADSLFIGSHDPSAPEFLRGLIEKGVSLSLPGSIQLAMGTEYLFGGSGTSAQISAHYINFLGGSGDPGNTILMPTGSLTFSADAIDLEGYLVFNFTPSLVFNATGDIRMLGAAVQPHAGENTTDFTQYLGRLKSAGDITFNEGQVYPATGQTYAIQGTGANSTIRFTQSSERPEVPLSAGGNLQGSRLRTLFRAAQSVRRKARSRSAPRAQRNRWISSRGA